MLKTGKLDSELLKSLIFGKITYKNQDVKVRPGIGEDCAVIGFGDYDCVMSTDPISSAVSDIGRLAIHITCNDIASNGVRPLGIMLAVMLPEGTSEEDVALIMSQAGETAAEVGVEIIGGHTEITPAVNQPVIVSTAIGKTLADTSQSGDNMAVGDQIMITKAVGLEGTGIIASDYAKALQGVLTEEEISNCISFFDLVSVVDEGTIAGEIGTHGMHDITEGGILGAVWEMCQIANLGAHLDCDKIPMREETRKLCKFFEIDPLRLISSGAMVIIASSDNAIKIKKAMAEANIEIATIGKVMPKDYGIMMEDGSGLRVIDPPDTDELYKVIGNYNLDS